MRHDKKNIINSLRFVSIFLFILFAVSGSMVFVEVSKIDSDFDGKIDQVEHFVGDKTLVKAEFDADKKGEMDQIQHYSEQGKLKKIEKDS